MGDTVRSGIASSGLDPAWGTQRVVRPPNDSICISNTRRSRHRTESAFCARVWLRLELELGRIGWRSFKDSQTRVSGMTMSVLSTWPYLSYHYHTYCQRWSCLDNDCLILIIFIYINMILN